MKLVEIHAKLDKLVHELASQQCMPDEWWRPVLAALHENIDDLVYERRHGDRRQSEETNHANTKGRAA